MAKFFWGVILLVAVIFGGFLWYQNHRAKSDVKSAGQTTQTKNSAVSSSDQGVPAQEASQSSSSSLANDQSDVNYDQICESAQPVSIADVQGNQTSLTGKLRKVYPDDTASKPFAKYEFFLEASNSLAITGKDLSMLDNFEDREVEIKGAMSSDKKEIAISELKCTGAETDQAVLGARKSIMNWLVDNINSVAPNKAKYQKWTVDTAEFVDQTHVYVEYYDTVADDENSNVDEDTSRKVLLEMTPKAGGYTPKMLAYWEMGEDDYVLKQGADQFENVDETVMYQYDSDLKEWSRV